MGTCRCTKKKNVLYITHDRTQVYTYIHCHLSLLLHKVTKQNAIYYMIFFLQTTTGAWRRAQAPKSWLWRWWTTTPLLHHRWWHRQPSWFGWSQHGDINLNWTDLSHNGCRCCMKETHLESGFFVASTCTWLLSKFSSSCSVFFRSCPTYAEFKEQKDMNCTGIISHFYIKLISE